MFAHLGCWSIFSFKTIEIHNITTIFHVFIAINNIPNILQHYIAVLLGSTSEDSVQIVQKRVTAGCKLRIGRRLQFSAQASLQLRATGKLRKLDELPHLHLGHTFANYEPQNF